MLIEFSVENFRSIRDRATLSMIAAKLRSRDPELDSQNTIHLNDKLSLLRSAVIYGANASGKSNIIKALHCMQKMIGQSAAYQPDALLPVEPFRLSAKMDANQPSTFEIVFLLEQTQYRYGFSTSSDRVFEEWLYYVPNSREVELFTRDEQNIHVGAQFREGKRLENLTRPNALFLSVVAQFNGRTATEIFVWMRTKLHVEFSLTGLPNWEIFPVLLFFANPRKQRIIELVRTLDIDISDILLVDKREADQPLVVARPPANLSDLSTDQARQLELVNQAINKEIQTMHSVRNDDGVIVGETPFRWNMESDGTQKLFSLACQIVNSLSSGSLMVIDEFDSSIHPLVTSALIKLFNSSGSNPRNAQLIFTTHDTNLMDRRYLRRDQIYFVEKDRSSATRLYSLAEFKIASGTSVRNDAEYERNYIQGRYGAIPFVGDLSKLLSQDDDIVDKYEAPAA